MDLAANDNLLLSKVEPQFDADSLVFDLAYVAFGTWHLNLPYSMPLSLSLSLPTSAPIARRTYHIRYIRTKLPAEQSIFKW